MKTRILIGAAPVVVLGGVILFLGCGAQPQRTSSSERGENRSDVSLAALAASPATTNPPIASAETVPEAVTRPPKLSPGVDEIVQLAQSGVGDEVLQAYIENSPVAYQLDVEQILYLHDLGLSAETIAAMVRRSQSLQDRSANSAAASVRSSETNVVLRPVGQPEAQPAAAAPSQNANASPVPSAGDSSQGPANAYAITPPQQVNYNYFYENLAPYGSWMEVPDYGWCWQPSVAVIDVNWRPYSNRGR